MGEGLIHKIFLICCMFFFISCDGKELILYSNNSPNYVIVVPENANAVERNAAVQLQKHLNKTTQSDFLIIKENQYTSLNKIFIGKTNSYKNFLSQNKISLGVDGILIQHHNKELIISGENNRAILYATYEFLEQFLKIDFLTPFETKYPILQSNRLGIDLPNVSYTPPFYYRSHYSYNALFNEEFAAILKQNGDFQKTSNNYGSIIKLTGWVHTFDQILPYKEYAKKHPEWYLNSQTNQLFTEYVEGFDGQLTQLDLSNVELKKVFIKNVLGLIKGNLTNDIISLSINDNKAFYNKSNVKSDTDVLIEFINDVALEIEKKYPKKRIETLAYFATEDAPVTVYPKKNVIIRFAPINSDMGYPIDSRENELVKKTIIDWKKTNNEMFYWGYNTNFAYPFLPYPSLDKTLTDISFLSKNNFKGVFIQDNTNPSEGFGYFQDMQTWVIAKMLWNPALDKEVLIKSFFDKYYDQAAQPMYSYYQLVEQFFKSSSIKLNAYEFNYSYLNKNFFNKADQLFAQAEKMAVSKELKRKIEKEKYSLEFLKIYNGVSSKEVYRNFMNRIHNQPYENIYVNKALKEYTGEIILSLSNNKVSSFHNKNDNSGVEIQENEFQLYQKLHLTNIEPDLEADNLLAAAIFGKTNDWSIQVPLSKWINKATKKNIEVDLKIVSINNQKTNDQILFGFYDGSKKQVVYEKEYSVNELVKDRYVTVSLNNVEVNKDVVMYIVFVNSRQSVDKIRIDKIVVK